MQIMAGAVRREVQVTGLVSFAHLLSHIYMFALVPLYPIFRGELGISYTEVGIAITVLAVFTGGLQTPMGFLVDRIGGRGVLIGGLFINAAAFGMVAFVHSFWELLALLAVAGIGASVFHPADYAILSVSIDDKRLGRAFALHSMGGQVGTVAAVPLMLGLLYVTDWRTAVMLIGGIGVALSLVMLAMSAVIGDGGKSKKSESMLAGWRRLVTSWPVLLFLVFYLGASAGNAGMIHFSIPAFNSIYGLSGAVTGWAIVVYQAMSLAAVMPGGLLADRTGGSHDAIMVWCFGSAAALVVLAGLGIMPFWLAVVVVGMAGGLRGLMLAARDVAVRHAVGPGLSVGTVFAFVTTGYSIGQALGPPIYGWLLDYFAPQIVFWASAAFSLLSISTVFIARRRRPQPALAE